MMNLLDAIKLFYEGEVTSDTIPLYSALHSQSILIIRNMGVNSKLFSPVTNPH